MNLSKIKYLIILSFLFQVNIYGQDWVSYESEQQINDLVEKGNDLYMATDAGLVVMNKTTLEKNIFNTNNSSLPSNHIQTITSAANGDIWIGTYDVSIAKFDGTDFIDILDVQNPGINANTNLYDLEIAANGDFWLGTSEGVLQKVGNTWNFFDVTDIGPDFFEAWDIEIDASGDVYVGSIGLYKLASGTWTNLFAGTSLQGYLDAELYFANDGILYFAGDLSRLASYDGTSWTEDSLGITINNFGSGDFAEDLNGDIYFDTNYEGIFKLDNSVWTLQSTPQTIAFNNRSNYFYIDNQGNKWLNNNIRLSVDKSGTLENTLISNTTLEFSGTRNLQHGIDGDMYFITNSNDNISVKDANGNWSFIAKPTISGNPFEFYYDVLALATDDIWIASGYGLYHYLNGTWMDYDLDACKSFATDSQGKIYVRSDNKIYVIENNLITEIDTSNSGITSLNIIGHGIDAEDNLWIAAGGFANDNLIQVRASDGTFTTYTEVDYPILARPIGNFVFDLEGNVWITNDAIGAIKFDGTSFTNPIQENTSLITNTDVYDIEMDIKGTLYFSHQYGVTTLKDGVFEELIIEAVPAVASSMGANIAIDNEGTLWWGSTRYGVFAYKLGIVSSINSNLETLIPVTVYPNPTRNFVNLELDLESSARIQANLYNNLGQIVGNYAYGLNNAGIFQKTIDVAHLPKGIYRLHIQINEQVAFQSILVE